MRPLRTFLLVLVLNLVLGVPAYFIAFLFAYGFRESVGVGNHVAFLVLVAVFALGAGLLASASHLRTPPQPSEQRLIGFGVLCSLALNCAVVGVGSIVSAAHKDENSVSAGFSTSTDVAVVTALFLAAIVLGALALRVGSHRDQRPG